MRILYIGTEATGTTSRHRADALRRLGHEVEIVNPVAVLPASRLLRALHFRTGYRLLTRKVLLEVQQRVADRRYDLAWIDSGYLVSAECVRWVKTRAPFVLNYCVDDPTGPRDPSKWSTYRHSIPEYDLCVVVREWNRGEYTALGARTVMRVMMGFDEVAHAPLPLSTEDAEKWRSDVVFVGTWMPERGPFLAELVRRGVPLAIHGLRWEKAPEWKTLEPHWRGAFASGADYVKAIQYAKVAIGMLSKGNRDMHTTRSTEIPYIGTVFCAERTPEHLQMFREGEEALFWSSAEECAAGCAAVLQDDARRVRIAAAARAKVKSLGLGNEAVCARILRAAAEGAGSET